MFQLKSDLVTNERLTEDCWRMVLDAPKIADKINPGQFVMLKINQTNDPLFRRPFTVFRKIQINQDTIGIEIVYRITGRGTKLMTSLKRGVELDIIGPLGRGFEWYRDKNTHVLVGGGTGSASLFMLGEEISRLKGKYGLEVNILLGAKTRKSVILEEEFKSLDGKMAVSTDDGSYGYHGLVTEMLEGVLDGGRILSDCAIYASGPDLMLKALGPICHQYGIPAQIAIERPMMCGIGACFVCVCKVDKNHVVKHRGLKTSHIQFSSEQWGYAMVCKAGPVFNIDEVVFDE